MVRHHEVDRLADRLDLRGLLVGHRHPVGVLELLDERVEVERVRVEVVAEVRGVRDARGIELELVGQMVLDEREDFVSRHGWSGTVATVPDASGARRRAPAVARWAFVRPSRSSRAPRAATSIARANPRAANDPCGTTARCRRPRSTAPPTAWGSSWSRSPRSA